VTDRDDGLLSPISSHCTKKHKLSAHEDTPRFEMITPVGLSANPIGIVSDVLPNTWELPTAHWHGEASDKWEQLSDVPNGASLELAWPDADAPVPS
jgi:hypothetical protein